MIAFPILNNSCFRKHFSFIYQSKNLTLLINIEIWIRDLNMVKPRERSEYQKRVLLCLHVSLNMYLSSYLSCDVIQQRLVATYRRFGTSYASRPQRSGSPSQIALFVPNTTVTNYKSTARNIPEERRPY